MRWFKILLVVAAVAVLAAYGALYVRDTFFTDQTAPVITLDSDSISVSVNDDESALLAGVTAQDDVDGDLTSEVSVLNVSQFVESGVAQVSYIVFDMSDNIGTATRSVVYTDYQPPHFELSAPLVFNTGSTVTLSDRLTVTDVLDGDLTGSIRLVNSTLYNDVDGIYSLTLEVTNSMGDTASIDLPVILRTGSVQDPEITLTDYLIYLPAGSYFDANGYIDSVVDPMISEVETVTNEDGEEVQVSLDDLTYAVTTDSNVDVNTPGSYRVFYNYNNETEDGETRSTSTVLTVVVE